ncbi:MAG TPA: LuxR C-terminal-related transcriptional regulator [Acidimicrobiia bacterium]|nr:LuxR C-terminal-related transcriptional regulator [Acidimicrobiia bacterium]
MLRRELLGRLADTTADLVVLTAPAGYGKTILLTQWAATLGKGRVAWLTLSESDNQAAVLLTRLAASVSRTASAASSNGALVRSLAGAELAGSDDGRLIRALSKVDPPIVLILDNVQVLRSRESTGVIGQLVRQLQGHVRLVIAGRAKPRLPMAALRAQGRLLELDPEDLALSEEEVGGLLEALSGPQAAEAARLTAATGGWPGAIMLLIAAGSAGRGLSPTLELGNDHRFLAQFIRDEVLPYVSAPRRELLRQLSPLERFSPSLAETVTGNPQAGRLLEDLATSSHVIYPADDPSGWYVMNRVLRRVLRADIEDNDPASASTVHARAAEWFETQDQPLEAIGHAQSAGDTERFIALMSGLVKARYAHGHVADVLLWMEWLESQVPLDRYPQLAAVGALVHAQEGNVLRMDKWLSAACDGLADEDIDPSALITRAASMRFGVEGSDQDIEMAERNAGPGSEWRPAIFLVKGTSHVIKGELDQAESCFAEVVRTGVESDSLPSVVMALGLRGLIAIDRHDWDLASTLSGRAMGIIDDNGLDGYHASGFALVVAARLARRNNDVARAQALLARASLIRPRMSAALPAVSVHMLLEMAKVYLELSDVAGARAVLREAEDILIQRPDLGNLPEQVAALKESMTGRSPGTVGISTLTKAELRLLPLLATNLSFPEIGEELYISRHTVKTQAMSIYRKLGTSSRSDAVSVAYDVGLLRH